MNDPPTPTATEAPRINRRSAVLAGLASMLAALSISVTPHLAWWPKIGEPVYIADHDDAYYLAFTSQAYFEHPLTIADPVLKAGGASQLPGAQLVPPVLVAKALGLGPVGVLLVWRVWGGLSIGLTCYLLALGIVKRPWIAAAVAILFFSDAGVLIARPLVRHLGLAARAVGSGLTIAEYGKRPVLMPHWRLITPSVSLAFLLAHAAFTIRARERPTRLNIALAGLSFGLLFHVYFYYWTAATVALGLLWCLDAGRRRVPIAIGAVGAVVGLPAILDNLRIKRDYPADWLHRMDDFLPIPRTSEWLIPWGTVAILAVAVPWAVVRRKDLLYLACLALAGLLMVNHQVVTGLQIQNWHWGYVWGPFTWLLIVFELLPLVRKAPLRPRTGAIVATIGLLIAYGFGIAFRAVESTRAPDSLLVQSSYASYRDQKRGPGWQPLAPNEVAAGSPEFLEIAAICDDLRPLDHYAVIASPSTREPEREDRIALNAALRGLSRDEFLAWQSAHLREGWGPWLRDPALREEKLARMMARFDRLGTALPAEVSRFQVRYLGLPAGAPADHLGPRWRRLQAGRWWDVYENLDRAIAPAGDGTPMDARKGPAHD